jgi:hypothetical protein
MLAADPSSRLADRKDGKHKEQFVSSKANIGIPESILLITLAPEGLAF